MKLDLTQQKGVVAVKGEVAEDGDIPGGVDRTVCWVNGCGRQSVVPQHQGLHEQSASFQESQKNRPVPVPAARDVPRALPRGGR